MSTKDEAYHELADRATGNLTAQVTDWIRFLLVAGKVYKYRFLDQVMIYVQRPDATACAEFDLWSQRMDRHIRRGSKGIALLRYRNGRIFLRYVFDVADTVRRKNGRDPVLWRYKADYEPAVTAQLEKAFGVPGVDGLAKQLVVLAVKSSNDHWNGCRDGIIRAVHGSSLDGLDEDAVGLRFRNAATVSLAFLLLARCGLDLDGYFTPEDFNCIGEFDTRDTVLALGEAVSESAGAILRQIERAVKACMSGEAPEMTPANQAKEHHPPTEDAPAAGTEGPAAGSAPIPERETLPNADPVPAPIPKREMLPNAGRTPPPGPEEAPPVAPGTPQEAAGQGHHPAEAALRTTPKPPEEASAEPAPAPGPEIAPPVAPGTPQEDARRLAMQGHQPAETTLRTAPKPPEEAPVAPAPAPGPEAALSAAPEAPQEAAGQLAMPGYHGPQAALPGPTEAAQEVPAEPVPAAANFRVTDEDLCSFGPKGRYVLNVEAIQTLRNVEMERRNATEVEQEMLARYTGWGAIPEAFDPERPEWAKEYAELKSLLTEDEYASARASVLNAHFTPPIIIRAIYDALGNMGFTSGNVLEPSCGTGNFFGCLPESMAASRLYGIELDSISGRIARLLYPKADITIAGFETTSRNDFYDVAVGNVPFGQYRVSDPAYDKHGFSIHNYFLCKMVDQLRPGGVMAVVTSRYTMDSKDSAARKYLAGRADLLGAIRLPNDAFKSAGTDVVSDILFFQKLDGPNPALPDWVSTMENQDGYQVNSYFLDYPKMVLGCPSVENTRYGHDYTVYPSPGADLAEQLQRAVARIRGKYEEPAGKGISLFPDEVPETIPAAPGVRDFSYALADGGIYYREGGTMTLQKLSAGAAARVKGLIALRDAVRETIDAQLDDCSDDRLAELQANLNGIYDSFTAAYGLVNSRPNRLAFDKDGAYYLLCSLEILDDDGNLKRKADMFTARTIRRHVPAARADTAQEALVLSISEKARVDLEYMSGLTGKPAGAIIDELQGQIFRIPGSEPPHYVPAGEYLSGNVRRKLREAQRAAKDDPTYQPNVDALLRAQPRDLDASEIEVRLGATWIPVEYYQQFMIETFRTPPYLRDLVAVRYSPVTSEWSVENKNRVSLGDVMAWATWGTGRASAYEILQDSLNLKDVQVKDTVRDPDGKERRVLNAKETTLAQQKQESMRSAFVRWCFDDDPHRRQELVRIYNETMNCIRPREYDGSNIVFHGINPEIKLRPHQLGAIAHVLYGGNTLLAHEVGAGKTFEMIASIMESKYLGLCSKAVMVVPNHLTQQTAAEFLRLYPAANILVTTKWDFETARRKKFCARIATGSWDAVIIGHSQFERIPISYERQKKIIDDQISDITFAVSEVKASKGERFTVRQLERMKKGLEAKLDKLKADWKKDTTVTFEQLGIDMMLVDESDAYKNLFLYTKMRNVAGLSTADAQKSSDMFAKCRYLDELTHGRGIVFASGTPISNPEFPKIF